MSQHILKFIAGNAPILNNEYAILSAPVRHVFMMGIVWYLTKEAKKSQLQIMEVGSWVGASALSWAQGLKIHNEAKGTLTCVDAWKPFFNREKMDNQVYITMEQALDTETAYHLFLHNISCIPKSIVCQHLRGQSENILPLLRKNEFDIIFIDADHAYTPVWKDLRNALSLVKEGGIICGDDLNLQLSEVDRDVAMQHAEDDFIKDPKTGRNFHPGVTLAVAEMFEEVSSWGGFWAMQKTESGWNKISLANMPIHYPEHFPRQALQKAESHLHDIKII
jgi:predicted O-methyltransferase YrrM